MVLLSYGCSKVSTAQPSVETKNTEPPVQAVSETPTVESTIPLPTPTVTQEVPTLSPTFLPPIIIEQPTAIQTNQPNSDMEGKQILPADIQIIEPGPNSRIASPIRLLANFYPGEGGKVLFQLLGEDGRLMAERLITVEVPPSGWVSQTMQIPFQISTAGEAALLSVITRDEYGRSIAQASVPIILLQIGTSEIEATGFKKDPFVLDSPLYSFVATKGIVHVKGFVHVYGNGSIVGDLISPSGGILGSIATEVTGIADEKGYIPFTMDIPYSVAQRTPVRLTLHQRHERLSQIDVSLKSVIIFLDP